MKNFIKSTIAIVLFIFNGTTNAQTNAPKLENSLLWEVSGKGLTKPSYLYGTVHMICAGDYFLSEKTNKAFEKSDKLVLEINFADPKEMVDLQEMVMGKVPLSKKLAPEQLSKLNVILQKNAGMTIQQVDSFSLLTVMSLISMKSFGCTDLKFYEMNFIEMAKKRQIEVGGLETVKSQCESFENAYSDVEMIAMLEETSADETTKLVANYKNEDMESLYKLTTDEKIMNLKAKKYMLDDRNANWIKIMPEQMKKESVFFAVGAAHLGGDTGIINLLRKAGYTVKPVMN
ncbi:TraB/GumN family protein [Flavobacterium sp. Fl-318]|uniref:TraB/GumN family protein n=1 Tax=Flavobacterium cupriresistens TaxID=2893885 RepID=A0ABU4RCG2_9FLAO|nr:MULTISPECIES: TraB/GumN family protein [unclassified Flavobacterium]MDX6190280.1 TraB/GumN family protein [Flavobacterium sp. Fl-318]UFH43348.1 TraB/GumN family protein [Flavobacterium sp. F-323]